MGNGNPNHLKADESVKLLMHLNVCRMLEVLGRGMLLFNMAALGPVVPEPINTNPV